MMRVGKGEILWMIDLTYINNKDFTLNSDLIETVEETPDTVITLTTGKKIIVKESRQKVKNLVKLYRKEIFQNIMDKN
jgi:flagellar protein FlbD